MKGYDHLKIEKKWQKEWTKKKVYKTEVNSKKKKYYVLDMFPYPSGAGLHVGHPRGYIGSDVYARYKRMLGYNVLHPMGYDAFGLPAEQYAIEHNLHPRVAVEKNIKTFERQLSIIGLSFDWERKVNTTDSGFYHFTQWIFLQIYNSWYNKKLDKAESIDVLINSFEKSGNKGVNAFTSDTESFTAQDWKLKTPKERQDTLMKYRLAYEGYALVNWCPKLGTVLANDEIVDAADGLVSERGGYPVEKKSMRQWFMRITAYADKLLSGLEGLNWSPHIKEIQRNWIGKSEGAEIEFKVVSSRQDLTEKIKVFTTRADTLFGVTYVVLAPEHILVSKLLSQISNKDEVEKYIKEVKNKSQEERTDAKKEKTGVILEGIKAVNPANGEEVSVWIADYVIASYGTGAVMAVPSHDERDFEFAKKYKLPIRQVIMPDLFDEKNPPLEGKKNTTRETVHVILRDTKNKLVLLQFLKGEKWKGRDPKSFIIGGIEENESIVETAIREIREETGYTNVKFVEEISLKTRSTFFAAHKDVNRTIHCYNIVFDLMGPEKIEIEEDEYFTKDSHEMKWVPYDKVSETISIKDDALAWKYYYSGGFAYLDGGILINSGQFDGLDSKVSKSEIIKFVGGKIVTNYKMRDAIFARQRYWGEPIPLIYDKEGIIIALKDKDLPLKLPDVKSYQPLGTGESPLAGVISWVKKGYETNTMPGWAGSSWYFLRYMDPKNKRVFADKKALKYWKDVNMYVGGAEHATGHLLYSRFWHKFLYDVGAVPTNEPFKTLKNQGMIGGADGRKMSKRWGNVINPDDIVKTYGADTLRVYEMFMGPFEQSLPWNTESIIGSRRFLEKVWKLSGKIASLESNLAGPRVGGKGLSSSSEAERGETLRSQQSIQKLLHKTIKKVTEDIESFSFNTAISSMMIFLNESEKMSEIRKEDFKKFLQILAPFASHIAEELWHELGEKDSIHKSKWPKWDVKKIIDDEIKIVVQVNGKVRSEIMIRKDITEEEVKNLATKDAGVIPWLKDSSIKRIIYVKNRLINIVV